MRKFAAIIFLVFIQNISGGENLREKAQLLSEKYIIVDTHIDLPLQMDDEWFDITLPRKGGEIDYPRAVKGGLNCPFMSIYVSSRHQGTPNAKKAADDQIDIVERIVNENPDKFQIAYTVSDVLNNFDKGIISLPMGIENGAPIENIELLQYYYERGVRYVTLVHAKWNHICDSSYDEERKWNGLSPFGKELIKEMNKIGMMVDLSHVTDETFVQALELSETPVIVSHSSCRFFTPGFERNVSDELIKKIAENRGVIQINFGSDFISHEYRTNKNNFRKELKEFMAEHSLKNDDPQTVEFENNYKKEHPIRFATVEMVADHIDHVVKIAGIDHVGIGSDFEGVGDSLPVGLKDVSMYPNLIYELLKRNYSEEDIEKICSGNLLRVWRDVENYAAQK